MYICDESYQYECNGCQFKFKEKAAWKDFVNVALMLKRSHMDKINTSIEILLVNYNGINIENLSAQESIPEVGTKHKAEIFRTMDIVMKYT